MLERLQHTLRAGIADIRTLVDELHPAALEMGLLPALREHVTGIWPVLAADVEAPDDLPPAGRGGRGGGVPDLPGSTDERGQARRRPPCC
jgi:hypothetical protein